MDLTLFYRGELKANGDRGHKHALRKRFAVQLARYMRPILVQSTLVEKTKGSISLTFRAPITRATQTTAEIAVTLLRPSAPGNIIQHGGDIDNRLKTLFDALRCPNIDEIPDDELNQIMAEANPLKAFACLLEDDALISSVSVRTDRLLDVDPMMRESEVVMLIHVKSTEPAGAITFVSNTP